MFKSIKQFLLLLFILYATFLIAQNDSTTLIENTFKKIDTFYESGNYDSILIYSKKLLPLVKQENKSRVLLEIGTALLYLEEYEEALNYYQKRLDYTLTITSAESEVIGDCYYYLACSHYELSNFNEALKYYKQSLNLTHDSLSFALTLSAMAGIYSEKSDYDNAISYEEQALHFFAVDGTPEDLYKSNNSLALYYYMKQNYQQAFLFSKQAVSFLEDEKIINAPTYNNYALILIQIDDFEKAAFYLQKALDSPEKQFFEVTQFNQAFLDYESKNYEKALTSFEEVIDIYHKKYPNGNTGIGKAWYYIGQIKVLQGQTTTALKAYQKSLQALVPDFTNDDLITLPSLNQYCRSHRNLLRTLIAKANTLGMAYLAEEEIVGDNSNTVFETFDLAIEIAETLRRSYRAEESQYFLAEETKTLFDQAIKFSHELYQESKEQVYLEKMLFYIEKSQAPILLQKQLTNTAQLTGGVPEALIKKEKQLAVDLTFYKNQQAKAKEKGDTTKINLYSNYLLEGIQELNNLKDTLQNEYPKYYHYQYATVPIDIATLQNTLAADQLLLHYYSTESILYTLAITPQSAIAITQDITAIESSSKDLLTAIQNPLTKKLPNKIAFDLLTNAAAQLYERLVQPALEKIAIPPKRLVVINNDFLTEIPFEVLLTKTPTSDENNYLSLDYLIKKYAVSYQSSASLFERLAVQKPKMAANKLLAIAPFAKKESLTAQAFTRSGFDNLPFTKQEVQSIEQLYETTALYEQAATKDAFLAKAPNYQILHLATHGVADFEEKANAHLLFHPEKNPVSINHILYNYEIQNLALKADLAVLSACETGAGKIDKGEGILNLARSFFYTGVPSVIMSKWKINDQSSSLIIKSLYQNLKVNDTKDEALQAAKVSYLENEADLVTAHPFYWAGLVQLGNAKALPKHSSNLFFLGISTGLGVLLLLFWQFFNRRS